MNNPHNQQGIGLIEAMIALALLMITAMAMGQLQTSTIVSAQGSSVHFSIDHLSSEMLAILRVQASDAEAGLFEAAEDGTTAGAAEITAWNSRIAEAIPTGIGSVTCADGFCDVSISWMEEIDGSEYRQYYRTRTPL